MIDYNNKILEIYPYSPRDIPGIMNIYNEHILEGGSTLDCNPYSLETMTANLKKMGDRETILVAKIEDNMIGWGGIRSYSDRPGYRVCCETSIYLSISQIGKGYGKVLQTSLLEKVREFGYHHIVVKILATNHKSIKFHRAFGFEIVGLQKEIGFHRGQWQDVVIMQLVFPDIPPYLPELC
jgi:phosphinothricin acetyltransferase